MVSGISDLKRGCFIYVEMKRHMADLKVLLYGSDIQCVNTVKFKFVDCNRHC